MAQVEEGREAGLPVERLQARREDRVGGRLHPVPAVHVRLDRVDGGAACALAARGVAVAVVPLLPALFPLLQGLAEQALVVAVVHAALVLALVLVLGAAGPQPGLALPVVSRRLGGGLPAGQGRGEGARGVPRPLQHRRVVLGVLLLRQEQSAGVQ